jgi:NAD-dependent dihydropyrimidine dehydrogenase PreA subunit
MEKMERILLIVFSGTGNTLLVAGMIRDEFVKAGRGADILDISRDGAGEHAAAYDIIGLGYPVYAFNTPGFFLRYVRRLALRDKKVFIFKSSGEPSFPNRGSSYSLISMLKGCRLLGDYHFLMPYNIITRFPDNLVKQMYLAAKKQSRLLAANVLAGRILSARITFANRIISFLFRIQRPGAAINGKLYGVKRKKCSRCLRCVRNCPAGNIRLVNGRLRFGFRCRMCMRCSFYCPVDALSIGLLDPWRVNGPFPFEALAKDESLDGRFINEHTRGIYRIYIPWFREICADQSFGAAETSRFSRGKHD